MPSSPPEFEAFARLLAGQYSLEREIGRGGMGIVYLGRDLRLDRPVAIKTLPPHLATDAKIRDRFLREARTAAALSHPNIVPIYRADEIDGQVFFVMGFVDGESVAERVRAQGRLDPRDVLRAMRDVASALGYAHAHGVVHRDVKAENILLDAATGQAMVTDFGIARLAEAAPLTATGQLLGTVYYMSPEQVSGDPLDGRSDLYSLGVVGFFALSGRFPFNAELASAVLVAHVTKAAPALLTVDPGAPRALAEIIDRCLAKDPETRFQTGAELADALRAAEGEVARDAARAPVVAGAPTVVSDEEAQAIWERAAALQAMTGVQARPVAIPRARNAAADANRTSGYQLAAVRNAAEEAGIPAQYVEHAMAEHGLVRTPDGAAAVAVRVNDVSPKRSLLAGSPTSIEYEAVVGAEMPERDFDLLVDVIRRRVGEAGALTSVGRSLTWNTMSRQRAVHVSVLSRGGKTTVRVVENLRQFAGGLFGGIMGGVGAGFFGVAMGFGMGKMHSPLLAFSIEAGAVVLTYLGARTAFVLASGKRRRTMRALTEELAEQARESIASSPAPLATVGASMLKPVPGPARSSSQP